jgi:hypothetical protein
VGVGDSNSQFDVSLLNKFVSLQVNLVFLRILFCEVLTFKVWEVESSTCILCTFYVTKSFYPWLYFLRNTNQTHRIIFKFRLPPIFGPDISALSVSIFLHGRPSKCTVQYIKSVKEGQEKEEMACMSSRTQRYNSIHNVRSTHAQVTGFTFT